MSLVTSASATVERARPANEGRLERLLVAIAADATKHTRTGDASACELAEAALLLGYLELAWPGKGCGDRAYECSELCIARLATEELGLSLLGGLLEVAWILGHLERNVFGTSEAADPTPDITALLREQLGRGCWHHGHDLVNGLSGLGVYALSRHDDWSVSEIVRQLARSAEIYNGGALWRTKPRWMAASSAALYPTGYFDLGVAHGVAGVLPVLAAASAAGNEAGLAGELFRSAKRSLLSHESTALGSDFPSFTLPDGRAIPGRTAWCYGGLGIAGVLLAAGEVLEDPALVEDSRRIAYRVLGQESHQLVPRDASLCHGLAGVVHAWSRLWHATRFPGMHAAALMQAQQMCDLVGVLYDGTVTVTGRTDRSLMTGSVGVGLALVSALCPDVIPRWDCLLLYSLDDGKPRRA